MVEISLSGSGEGPERIDSDSLGPTRQLPPLRCPTSFSRPRRVAYVTIRLDARLVAAVSSGRRVVIAG
jgi:hypothetical protein